MSPAHGRSSILRQKSVFISLRHKKYYEYSDKLHVRNLGKSLKNVINGGSHMGYIMALDAGTTSNRCILFNEKGEI